MQQLEVLTEMSPELAPGQGCPRCDSASTTNTQPLFADEMYVVAHSQACPLCDLDVLAASGSCIPGTYTLTYAAVNEDGLSATASRQLYVYQAAAVTVPLQLYAGVSSYSQALVLVAGLSNASLPAYAAGIDDVIAKLGSLAGQVEPGDVDINAAAWRQQGPGSYSVHVSATVYLFPPTGVHRQDIRSFEQPEATGTQEAAGPHSSLPPQRHLLWSETVTSPDANTDVHWRAVADALLHGTSSSGIADERGIAAEAPPLLHSTASPGTAASATATAATSQLRLATEALHSLQQSISLLELMLKEADCADRGGGVSCDDGAPVGGQGRTARHLLQATGEQNLADLIAGLAAELGTNLTTQPLTQQGVDLLTVRPQLQCATEPLLRCALAPQDLHSCQKFCFCPTSALMILAPSHVPFMFGGVVHAAQAYMSALTSSIRVLQQQVGRVNDTSASLSSFLSQAFGDNSLQWDSQLDVQVMQLYQVRPPLVDSTASSCSYCAVVPKSVVTRGCGALPAGSSPDRDPSSCVTHITVRGGGHLLPPFARWFCRAWCHGSMT